MTHRSTECVLFVRQSNAHTHTHHIDPNGAYKSRRRCIIARRNLVRTTARLLSQHNKQKRSVNIVKFHGDVPGHVLQFNT